MKLTVVQDVLLLVILQIIYRQLSLLVSNHCRTGERVIESNFATRLGMWSLILAPKGRVLGQMWYPPMSKTILLDLNSCFDKKNCRYKILPRHMWCFRDASSEVLCLWFQCLIKSNLISCTWPKPFFKPIPFLVVVHLRSHQVVPLFEIIKNTIIQTIQDNVHM